jgi:hypothetical protein
VSSRLGGRFVDGLRPVEAELAGELVPEGAVLGPQAGDLGAGGIEPLAERAGACAVSAAAGGSCLRRSLMRSRIWSWL